jgi:ubiquinone/menaquinone biosynthesis C-methylase UbiE
MTLGEETTFRNFTAQKAQEYNASRGRAYPAGLYEHILAYHKTNGREAKLAVDVGCGPGNATRDLSAYFEHVIGLDASPGMINTARELYSEELKGKVSFEATVSEKIHEAPGIKEHSVDVITAATAVSNTSLLYRSYEGSY